MRFAAGLRPGPLGELAVIMGGAGQWCIAKWRWVYANGRGKGPEGTLLILKKLLLLSKNVMTYHTA